MKEKLGIYGFGEALISTKDLDPVYVAIQGAHLDIPQLARLLVAYWCFYHLGAAAYLSECDDPAYWDLMVTAARNETPAPSGGRWPRAAERRHFRGEKCVEAVKFLSRTSAQDRIDSLSRKATEIEVMDEVKAWPMFGPWIAFKAADMLERCCGVPLHFSASTITMYAEPRKALDTLDPSDPLRIYDQLMRHFNRFQAPPAMDRACGPQEVETILCKWKSQMGGHYWVGKDIHEVEEGLEGWGETSKRLVAALRAGAHAPELI